jgi:hypothetical protein
MLDDHSAVVLDGHIAILRDNILVLTQQASEQSGAGGKKRFTIWIAQQRSELDLLLAQRSMLRR